MIRLRSTLEETFLSVKINRDALRNFVRKIEKDGKDAEDLVRYMDNLKISGKLVHFSDVFTDKNVFSYIPWSFTRSEDTVHKYNDVVFWDATHNMTAYSYKL